MIGIEGDRVKRRERRNIGMSGLGDEDKTSSGRERPARKKRIEMKTVKRDRDEETSLRGKRDQDD